MALDAKRQRPKPTFGLDLPIQVLPFGRRDELERLVAELHVLDRCREEELLLALERLAR
jgi:hypothetical protein